MRYIDLHSHTTHSDGTSTVTNSLQCAQELSLSVFSVSDHNTMSAYTEIAEKRELFSGRILPAVELGTSFEKENIEILGYGIDIGKMSELIEQNYLPPDAKNYEELKLHIRVVTQHGAVLDEAYLEKVEKNDPGIYAPFGGARAKLLEELKKFPENAAIFGGKAEFDKIDRHIFARQWLSNPNSTLYCDRTGLAPSLEKTVDMIHSCGGLAFLAHAFVYSPMIIQKLSDISKRLDGIECHYGTFSKEQKTFLTDFCDKNGLHKSGGSDFHGLDMRPKNIMGLSDGERIEYSLAEPWLKKMKFI